MIFVQRNSALIPEKLLKDAESAQKELEALPADQRVAYIKKKAHIWRSFAGHLAGMSYGKCWYSESHDPQSFFDVDHYRPKGEAVRSPTEKDEGYPWLAFSWENFRYSAQRSNRLSTHEDNDETTGKHSWFPLMPGSPRAEWANRCEADEQPVLLDPTVRADVDLVDIDSDGRIQESRACIGSSRDRLKRSVELYGLDLPNLVTARKRVMREVIATYEALTQCLEAGNAHPSAADALPVQKQIAQLRRATCPQSPYSKAARAQLILLGGAYFCSQPEDCESQQT